MCRRYVKMEKSGNLKEIKLLLEKFTNAHGVSGSEDNIRDLLEMEIEPYVDTIRKDVMGNLIATKKGEGPSIMLAAHMDEIGLMVKYISLIHISEPTRLGMISYAVFCLK